MRFLHTADLHLGRKLNELPLLEDQKLLLQQIVAIAVREKIDAVLIAGDIYNKSSPASDAMMAFDGFLSQLALNGIKVFMISGNHDSGNRISYLSSLIRKADIYTCEGFDGTLQQVTLEDEFGELHVFMMPFVRPAQIRKFYPDEEITSYEDAVRVILQHSSVNESERNVLVCHQFVTGAELSDSEDFAVGTLDSMDASLFDAFDYVALGHLHKAQKVRRESLRYSGSIMKYSLSEANHKKSVVILDMGDSAVEVQLLPLEQPKDIREVKGTLEQILEMAYSEDYVSVVLQDEFVPPDARVSVATVFPNMIKLSVENSRSRESAEIIEADSIESKSKMQLFEDFYQTQSGGTLPDPDQRKLMETILKELEESYYEAD